jgi:metal-dependent amidase/aminoacylase/carboxypeptidase family protein
MAVVQYQTIISRVIDPQETAVLTVGSIQAGTDNNVIPESALLKINLRFFNTKVRQQMIDGISAINNGIARTYGMSDDKMPKMTMKGGSGPLVNSQALVTRLNVPLKSLLGEKNVVTEMPAATGSEDVHLLLGEHTKVPLAFIFTGVADPAVFAQARKEGKFAPYSVHNPNYIVDLAAIPVGTKVATAMAMELLSKK